MITRPAPAVRRRSALRSRWRRTVPDTAYIVSGFALSVAWWSLFVTLLATGIGLSVTLVGLPILAGSMYLWTVAANTERWRARALVGEGVVAPYRPLPHAAFLRHVFAPSIALARARDPAVWRDLAYLLLVFFPLATATFTIAVIAWAAPLMLVAQPGLFWNGNGLDLGEVYTVDTLPEAAACLAIGIALLVMLPWLLRRLVAAHAWTVRALLGPRASERVTELTRQRGEAVEAAVAERRRIERDLHDGAQQRLTALAIDLGRARAKLEADPASARALVEHAHEDAMQALTELRNLARGIHPAILTDRGLDAALSALAARNSIPVEFAVDVGTRPPVAIESAAYFVVAEALANAAKHAAATRVRVRVSRAGATLVVEVEDDGVGGATLDPGGGLQGLETRVATVDGTLSLSSPAGGPTLVKAELPCAS